jgi:uncharacterized protein
LNSDPKEILSNLESALNKTIIPSESILFLDEIQVEPDLLAKLRWFYENMPELPVVAAGSLLEFVLENHTFSMPVGRINYCFVEPLGFEEFLYAKQETHLLSAIQHFSLAKPFNDVIHQKANRLFKEYMTVGGMPEAVATWIETGSLAKVSEVHNNLLNTYLDDFAKYAGKLALQHLHDALLALPRLLTNKMIYSRISATARHENIKKAVDLLCSARICHKVQATHANGIPLGGEIEPKTFKMILLDIGLASSLLGLQLHQFKSVDELMLINKGALTEQVIGQLLRLLSPYYVEPKLYYWCRQAASSSAEIDYLLQNNQQVLPVEIKSGTEGKLRSLHQFMADRPWPSAVRFYAGNVVQAEVNTKTTTGKAIQYDLLSLPLYLTEQLPKLLQQSPVAHAAY